MVSSNAQPEDRSDAALAYSPTYDRMLLFGGSSTPGTGYPFLYDPSHDSWSQPCSGDEPYPQSRSGPRSVWMDSIGTFLSLGGEYYDPDQTFALMPRNHEVAANYCFDLDGQDPSGGRAWSVLAPIAGAQALVYGGLGYTGVRNDCWILQWSGHWTWQEVLPSVSPNHRYQSDAAYDPVAQRIYLLGGYDSDFVPHNDLWAVSAPWTQWEQLDPGGEGSARPIVGRALLVADPDTGYLYHFGPGSSALEVWLYIP